MNAYILRWSVLFGVLISLFGQTAWAAWVPSQNIIPLSSQEYSCAWANKNHRFYLPHGQNSLVITPSDNFRVAAGNPNTLTQILESSSQIAVWNNSASPSCAMGWYRASWVVPGDGEWYSALFRPNDMPQCTIQKPTTPAPNTPALQLVYKVAFKRQTGLQQGVTSGYYYFKPRSTKFSLTPNTVPNNTRRTWGPEQMHANECQQFYVSYCGDGVVDNGTFENGHFAEQCDPAAPGQSPDTCDPVTCKPKTPTQTPVCSSAITGTQPNPISSSTPGLCQIGTVANFQAVTGANGQINYTWQCTGTNANPVACSANYRPTGPDKPDLSIKKRANGKDGQNLADAAQVNPGENFQYTYEIKNTGKAPAKKVTVTDTFPRYVSVTAVPTGTNWTCRKGTKTVASVVYHTVTCTYNIPLPAGATAPTVTVPVRLDPTTPFDAQIRNIAYVCDPEDPYSPQNPNDPRCNPDCIDPNDPKCTPPPPPNVCSDIPGHPNYDPACVVPAKPGMDLAIKKYINSDDAQPNAPVALQNGSTFSYILRVQNVGTLLAKDTTTVKDILPSGVEIHGTPTGTNWTCNYAGKTLTCTTTQQVDAGKYFTDITVPVKVNAGSNTTVRNDATVHNPNETNGCYPDNRIPNGNEQNCTKDPRNTDPAVFKTPGPGGGGGKSYYVPKCINTDRQVTCATQVYRDHSECRANNNNAQCYETLDDCNKYKTTPEANVDYNVPHCKTTPPGPGGPPPGPGGGYTPYCGNGILEPGEQCDPGTGKGPNNNTARAASAWCEASCTVKYTTTNPGENPITDMWIKIPLLSHAKLGYTWLDGEQGKVRFSEHRVVVGKNTPVFTLADTIQFGISTKYRVPLQLEADRQFCLQSNGAPLGENTACMTLKDATAITWKQPNGEQEYVVIGEGDYLVPVGNGKYTVHTAKSPREITLFHGNKTYGSKMLRDTFVGKQSGSTKITLGTKRVDGAFIELVSMPVAVSSSVVGTTATPVNRLLGRTQLTKDQVLKEFLRDGLKIHRTTSTSTDVSTTPQRPHVAVTPIRADITAVSPATITRLDELPSYRGNAAIRAVKWNLTVACPAGKTVFEMRGTQTILVEGDIIFRCNTGYPSGDTTSSWAWIAKGGDIKVYNGNGTTVQDRGITNIAGVYVAIPENHRGGNIASHDPQKVTAAILRVDGTLYGNAKPLFDSRTYARGSNAYEILTTGTVLSYSNRALINPPPLLSQYLNNYKIQRVVR